MSDMRKIIEVRKTTRDQSTVETRQVQALEDLADSMEGIRIDLTLMSSQLTHLIQAIGTLQKR